MIRTITIGTYVSIQGYFVENLPGGHIAVRVDGTIYKGKAVQLRSK